MKKIIILLIYLYSLSVFSQEMPVINEVMVNLQGTSAGRRWVEIYNGSVYPYSLNGWVLQTAGQSFNTVFTFPDIVILPEQYIVIGENQVDFANYNVNLNLQLGQNNTVGARLISADGSYKDTVLWSSPNNNNLSDDISDPAVEFAPRPTEGHSLSRNPNGYDSNKITDWKLAEVPTPGRANFIYIDFAISEIYESISENSHYINIVIHDLSTENVDKNNLEMRVTLNDLLIYHDRPNIIYNNNIAIITISTKFLEYSINFIFAEISYPHDVDLSNNTMSYNFWYGNKPIIINEMQFQPSTNEPEWIEFFNRTTETLIIENAFIRNANGRISQFSAVFNPLDYFIITQDIEMFSDTHPAVDLTKVVQPDSWAVLVNTRDTIELYFSETAKMDSLSYVGVTNMRGRSLERHNPFNDTEVIWGYNMTALGSSPLEKNSVTRNEIEAVILSVDITSVPLSQILQHQVNVQNIGLTNGYYADLLLLYRNETTTEYRIIHENQVYIYDEIIEIFTTSLPNDTGYHYFTYKLIFEDGVDNFDKKYLNTNPPVVINEIMFQPNTNEPIWIEFIKTREQMPLEGLKFFARSDSIHIPYFESEYAVLTTNAANAILLRDLFDIPDFVTIFTGLRTLLNAGQEISLIDYDENIYENFSYLPAFSLRRGFSAERISPSLPPDAQNFTSSLIGGTPGIRNSVFMQLVPTSSSVEIDNNPFSPFRGEHCIIRIKVSEQMVNANVRIFDIKGRDIKKLADRTILPGDYALIWNGYDDENKRVSPGVYPVYINIENMSGKEVLSTRKMIYVGM